MKSANFTELQAILTEIEPQMESFANIIKDDELVTIVEVMVDLIISIPPEPDINNPKQIEELHCVYNDLIAWALLGKTTLNRMKEKG